MTLLATARQPLPATPPIEGPLWSIVVPALLLLFATAATWMLYRYFARRGPTSGGPE